MRNFVGAATPFSEDAVHAAAEELRCDVAAIKAVIDVESRGGFLKDKRPKILFERHIFSRRTDHRFDAARPDISNRIPGGYKGGAAEYDRLHVATMFDEPAAMESASWGAFQIMGYPAADLDFANVDMFCDRICRSEDDQLDIFVAFIRKNRLDDELGRRDWTGFARGYNGAEFAKNRYDVKLGAAYTVHATNPPRTDPIERTLKMGDVGEDVARLQDSLGVAADGDFGPATKTAVLAFQSSKGLKPDGTVGQGTRKALGL